MTTSTMAELIKREAMELMEKTGKMVYFSKPYSCAMEESLIYFKNWGMPLPGQMTIEKEETQTTISLKPRKGSGKRKLYVIKIWVA